MTYSIVEPPLGADNESPTKRDLLSYSDWFLHAIPNRIREIEHEVNALNCFSDWKADFSPDSLDRLAEWLQSQVALEARSKPEMQAIQERLKIPIEVSNERMSTRSASLAVDAGMYFGEVLIRNTPETRWEQLVKSRNHVDYGQLVVQGPGKTALNPIRVLLNISLSMALGESSWRELRSSYDFWRKKLSHTKRPA